MSVVSVDDRERRAMRALRECEECGLAHSRLRSCRDAQIDWERGRDDEIDEAAARERGEW